MNWLDHWVAEVMQALKKDRIKKKKKKKKKKHGPCSPVS